jgi:hypothetical protein
MVVLSIKDNKKLTLDSKQIGLVVEWSCQSRRMEKFTLGSKQISLVV